MKKLALLALLPVLVAGCTDTDPIPEQPGEDMPQLETPPRQQEDAAAPPPRPVRIGELGPRFAACSASGRVTRAGLALRPAPFERAEAGAQLDEGTQLRICNRSLDQEWLGVVVLPEGRDAAQCGTSEPVRTPRDYDGPCPSGWVEAAFVRVFAS